MKSKLVICSLLVSFCVLNTHAQEPGIEWQKCLGGSNFDEAISIKQTKDGGFIVAGFAGSYDGDVSNIHAQHDFWIIKLDAFGNISWNKCLGGSSLDAAFSIEQTYDGGYIVAGGSQSTDGDVSGHHGTDLSPDYWIVKLDTLGDIQWQRSLGGSNFDFATSIHQTSDGGFIVAGHSGSGDGEVSGNHGGQDYWIVKLFANGLLNWEKSLGGSKDDYAYSIEQTSDGGFIVGGWSFSSDGDVSGHHGACCIDYWIVKLNASAEIEWQKSLGGSGFDEAHFIQQTTDGGFIVAGTSSSHDGDVTGNHGFYDLWIVKLNSQGSITWQKCLGGIHEEDANCIQQTSDGGFIVAGLNKGNDDEVSGNHGGSDYWIVKIDAFGNIEWQKSLGGSDYDEATFVQQTTDGGFVAGGFSWSNDGNVTGNHGEYDYWIVKLLCTDPTIFYFDADADGYGNADISLSVSGCTPPPGYVFDNTDCNDTAASISPGAYEILNGVDDNCNGAIDEGIVIGIDELTQTKSSISVYPNPATNFVTMKLDLKTQSSFLATISIINLLGETLLKESSHCSNGHLTEGISLNENFSPGIYFVRVSSDQQQWTAPLVVEK